MASKTPLLRNLFIGATATAAVLGTSMAILSHDKEQTAEFVAIGTILGLVGGAGATASFNPRKEQNIPSYNHA